MRIHGLVVCVDYAAELAQSLPMWMHGLDSVVVVTTSKDKATVEACDRWSALPRAIVYQTDIFYASGASFNKGAAITEAVEAGLLNTDDWVLLFDADVVPPADWKSIVQRVWLTEGHLYGAFRQDEKGKMIADNLPAGFFMLFHGKDSQARVKPFYDTHWLHAGAGDTFFMERWPQISRHCLPLFLKHLGEPNKNWDGRNNPAKRSTAQIYAERSVKGFEAEMIAPEFRVKP